MCSAEANLDKINLRKDLLLRRRVLCQENPEAGAVLRNRLLSDISWVGLSIVAGYWPYRGEVDVRPSLEALHRQQHVCCLPVVSMNRQEPLRFRQWSPGDPLKESRYGTREPMDNQPFVYPTVLLVPMLGFDRKGHRLGYGVGHYDRTLRFLRQNGSILAIGVAFSDQELPHVPVEAHDEPMDWVVTDRYSLCFI